MERIRSATLAGLLVFASMLPARAATPDVAVRMQERMTALARAQSRDEIVRDGNALVDFTASLSDVEKDRVLQAQVDALISRVGTLALRDDFATMTIGHLGRRAANALPLLQRLGWESPTIVCEPEEIACVRSGPSANTIYLYVFEDIRADIVVHGGALPTSLERGNDLRIRQGVEAVRAARDATDARTRMDALTSRAMELPGSAMARLEDSTIDVVASLLEREPDIRFSAATLLRHAGHRAARALPALRRAREYSVGISTGWNNGGSRPIPGEELMDEILLDIVKASP